MESYDPEERSPARPDPRELIAELRKHLEGMPFAIKHDYSKRLSKALFVSEPNIERTIDLYRSLHGADYMRRVIHEASEDRRYSERQLSSLHERLSEQRRASSLAKLRRLIQSWVRLLTGDPYTADVMKPEELVGSMERHARYIAVAQEIQLSAEQNMLFDPIDPQDHDSC